MTHPSFDALYAQVPADQREALRRFRETHPLSSTQVHGMKWEYIASGQGAPLLLLVGGLRVADAGQRAIEELEGRFRVITPTYPGVSTMSALAEGLAGVLEAEGIRKVHVLAGSFGGMVAQVFARRFPDRVDRLVLSTTGAPDSSSRTRYEQGLQALTPVSDEIAASMAQAFMFQTIAPPESHHAFYRAYLEELYTQRLSKAELLSTYECLIDLADHYQFAPGDLAGWQGQMLILESDDDATFDAEARAAVRALYSAAQTFVFHGAGHSPASTQRELYFRVVSQFLSEGSLPA